MFRETILLLMFANFYTQYTLTLDFPLLLENQYANITTVKQDGLNGFHVAFQNNQYRHYSADFSNYTSFTLSYTVQQICSWRQEITGVNLSNGTTLSMNSSMTVTFSNHHRTMRVYNQTTMNEIQSYTFNQAVIFYHGVPVEFLSNFIPHHFLFTSHDFKIIYNGAINVILNFSQVYQPVTICTSAIFASGQINKGTDYFQFTYYFAVALNSRQFQNISVVVHFRMNYTSSLFDLSFSYNKFTIFTPSHSINKMLIRNSLILMQSNTTGTIYLYNSDASVIATVDGHIPRQQVFGFFQKLNRYYLLQSNGLIEVLFDAGTNTLSFVNSIASLTVNNYGIAIGSQLDVFYIPKAPYVYKAGLCINQSLYDGVNTCRQYNCTTLNCFSCSFSSSVCSVCSSGFTRDKFYQCSSSNIANQTNQLNKSISTYSNSSLFFFLDLQWMDNLLVFLTKLIKILITIPAARKIVTPLFYYFSNFDDLFLYSLHNREYGDTINRLFQHIINIENQKWTLVSFQQLCQYIGINSSKIMSILLFQQDYTFFSKQKTFSSEGIISNCLNFLLIELLIIFLGFIILKIMFKILSKFSISQIFRRFDFWLYFLILIFEGNVQQFTFYLTTQLRTIFAFKWTDKYVKMFIIFFGHFLFIFSVGGYFIGLSFYKKLNHYFTDNNKNSLHGNLLLILQNGMRNVTLGVIHSIFRGYNYQYLIGILIIIETLFFIIFLLGISYQLYIEKTKIWMHIILTLVRMLLIITFSLDIMCINQTTFDQIQKILIFIMASLYILSIIFFIFDILNTIKSYFIQRFCASKNASLDIDQHTFITQPPRLNFSIHAISTNNTQSRNSLSKFIIKIKGAVISLQKPSRK